VPEPVATAIEPLARARERVLERIGAAAARAGRDTATVQLVAVSKTVPIERLRAAVAAGLTVFGENRVQEAEEKVGSVEGARWHLVGPLQSNKARRAIAAFDVIESVDTIDLAERLDRLVGEPVAGTPPSGSGDAAARRLPVLLQVNIDEDPSKAGFEPGDLERAIDDVLALTHLDVRGLMTIGRLVEGPEEARPTFRALRILSERLRARAPALGPELSMGMSADFEIAIEEGATIVRVGQAIFGERPHQHGDAAPHRHPTG
jgi:hypothetical protein